MCVGGGGGGGECVCVGGEGGLGVVWGLPCKIAMGV